jgi:hypothetical protein
MSSPRLSPKIVADDVLLAATINEFVGSDDASKDHRRKILKLEEELRAHVGEDAWQVFLNLDAADAARMADMAVALVQWAFTEGLRYGGGLRGCGR